MVPRSLAHFRQLRNRGTGEIAGDHLLILHRSSIYRHGARYGSLCRNSGRYRQQNAVGLDGKGAVGNFGERLDIDVGAPINLANGRCSGLPVDDQRFITGALREQNSREDENNCKG